MLRSVSGAPERCTNGAGPVQQDGAIAGRGSGVYSRPMGISDSPATLCLLVLTIGISIVAFMNPRIRDFMILAPYRMTTRREYHQVVTAGFIHANYGHLAINMLTLFFFGPSLEAMDNAAHGNRAAFLFIYAFSLVVGNLYPLIKFRRNPAYHALGASGALSGLVFAYCLMNPGGSIYLYGAIKLPVIVYGVLFVGYSIYAMRKANDNVGHEAHLAGAFAGLVATFIAAPDLIPFLH